MDYYLSISEEWDTYYVSVFINGIKEMESV